MAKAKPAQPQITLPAHCTSCGQKVRGERAVMAANPSAVFCCNCGFVLDSDGKCSNNGCKFLGFIPHCS